MKRKLGFTLIEMLTVIVIIAVLAALTMKLMVYVNQKTGKARAAGDLERIKHALTEYYAVYGCYPPVTGVTREFKGTDPNAPPDSGLGFYDGLATYLFADAQKARWEKFLTGWPDTDTRARKGNNSSYGNVYWTNNVWTILDPWDRAFDYSSANPYQNYKLFSYGPDGSANTADDVGNKWAE